jgi:deaminated glutathione amidase
MSSRVLVPGNEIVCVDMGFAIVGLTVCFDLRFPSLFQALRYGSMTRPGADIILVPSAFTVPTGQAHWEILLRARAIETQCLIIAAAQAGQHNQKRSSYGHSMIIDAWGTVGK